MCNTPVMIRHLVTFALVLIASTIAAQERVAARQYTDAERIAERTDRAAAAERVAVARAAGRAAEVLGRSTGLADFIDGRHSPQLFLPTELFETLVRAGYVFDGGRDAFAHGVAAAALPPSFWEQLATIAPQYIDDLREEARLADARTRDEATHALPTLRRRLCQTRATALRDARQLFGPALDVLLYRHVAPTKTLLITHVEDAASLRSREAGCR
jgi:hypothetical protein